MASYESTLSYPSHVHDNDVTNLPDLAKYAFGLGTGNIASNRSYL